jgi:HlyD family secretion protein
MKNITYVFAAILLPLLFSACGSSNNKYDATGTFESEEVIVSSEATGNLQWFTVEEGDKLQKDQVVGVVDTIQLYLKKKQLLGSITSALSKRPDIATQLATIQKQIDVANTEKKRFENLVQSNAATSKQLDDINSQLDVLKKQYAATKSSLTITSQGLDAETLSLKAQIDQLNDQIVKSIVKNPIDGTVITKYAKQSEVTANGKALYKIADLSTMILRIYVSGDQLVQIKLGQRIRVFVDDGKGGYRELQGTIYWISSKSEFTPKTIQTKDERANLVYAVKVHVKNDGLLKMGMYGEVKF